MPSQENPPLIVQSFRRFGDLVRALRKRDQMSQRALAKALSVSPGYIGQWELGLSQPSPEVVVRLCQLFEIGDIEYAQRLAYAERAPTWLRSSILGQEPADTGPFERGVLRRAAALEPWARRLLNQKVQSYLDGLESAMEHQK